jgi:hypothetical protein
MEHYGNIVVKFAYSLDNKIFICDWSEFRKTELSKKLNATKEDFIRKQIKYFKIPIKNISFLEKYYKQIGSQTSKLAYKLYDEYYINRYCNGMIFTGKRDGKVLVVYDTDGLIPLSARIDGQKEFKKSAINKNYLKKWMKQKGSKEYKPKERFKNWLMLMKDFIKEDILEEYYNIINDYDEKKYSYYVKDIDNDVYDLYILSVKNIVYGVYEDEIDEDYIPIDKNSVFYDGNMNIIIGDVVILDNENLSKIPEKYRDILEYDVDEIDYISKNENLSVRDLVNKWDLSIENPEDDWSDLKIFYIENYEIKELDYNYEEVSKERLERLIMDEKIASIYYI